ncbi:MAG TPA: Na+:solute symporter [Saprospiraceae bacterium]|nr:Na+:solute symporter [Saprospiraceae bacterium]MCB9271374.1 Na+:solute symporter [Lewinellaceae bacterium]HPG07265.1 Na+:solute symporter [Saprospiraceae bacterium]HPR00647.1 Na+:solute symporter [Saprospiraceae bacterium]HRV83803.1 Na+:solute symporter [Saprospiraceae bacterium]
MALNGADWIFIIAFFIVSLVIGLVVAKQSGKNTSEFFLSGRSMPWWLLGVSMVATTFSADTPNLVTSIVRQDGVAGNWVWWAFLITGMMTVFVYAKLWRRSGVLTDLEFYELRYSGKMAAFLRGFRAIYLGFFFNVMILATVSLAAIKMGSIMLGLKPWETLLYASVITVIYSAMGGLRGVIITDFFQFGIAMAGSIIAAIVIMRLPEVGGVKQLLSHPEVQAKLNILPDLSDTDQLWSLLILPLAIQWWSVWYPGAEPGGGGYIAQRMLAAKDENHAVGATMLFNAAHYALRPWPWILIALASLVVFPQLENIQAAFPQIPADKIGHDLGYPAMLTFLPHGLLGLVVASLIAAFMSTLSTQLNWGSSYLVNDFYRRFVNPNASEKQLVSAGRISTVALMIFAAVFALLLTDALQGFSILLQIGAGTGLIFILRWFWWRINAYSELAAMVISFAVALYFELLHTKLGFDPVSTHWKLIIAVGITTVGWLLVTFLTRPTDHKTLVNFYRVTQPDATGWQPVVNSAVQEGALQKDQIQLGKLPLQIACIFIGCFAVYGSLFAAGFWIYGRVVPAIIGTIIAGLSITGLLILWNRIRKL